MIGIVLDSDDGGGRCTVSVRHEGVQIELPALWLRERSPAPDARDATTGQRLFDPHLLAPDLFVEHALLDAHGRLRITFSDGHLTTFGPEELLADLTLTDRIPPTVMWDSALGHPPVHDWRTIDEPGAERSALHDLLELGVVLIDHVPTRPGGVLEVASRIGYVRDTNFGATFEVRSVTGSSDLAYRSVALGPHTDNPYRQPVPGVQLLHCLLNETSGGESTIVDGLAAVDALDDDAIDLLATVPLRFRYCDELTDLVAIRPIVERDHRGTVTGLHYSPRLDAMPLMPADEMRRYQAARNRLAELLVDPQLQVRLVLRPGQVLMFDNNRVLHGRAAFDPVEGIRHLQGCYLDLDGPRARYRTLVGRSDTDQVVGARQVIA